MATSTKRSLPIAASLMSPGASPPCSTCASAPHWCGAGWIPVGSGQLAAPCPSCNTAGSRGRPYYLEPTPEALLAARKMLGLTQAQMAWQLGFMGRQSRSAVSNLESGARPIRAPQARIVTALLDGWRPHDLGFSPPQD